MDNCFSASFLFSPLELDTPSLVVKVLVVGVDYVGIGIDPLDTAKITQGNAFDVFLRKEPFDDLFKSIRGDVFKLLLLVLEFEGKTRLARGSSGLQLFQKGSEATEHILSCFLVGPFGSFPTELGLTLLCFNGIVGNFAGVVRRTWIVNVVINHELNAAEPANIECVDVSQINFTGCKTFWCATDIVKWPLTMAVNFGVGQTPLECLRELLDFLVFVHFVDCRKVEE